MLAPSPVSVESWGFLEHFQGVILMNMAFALHFRGGLVSFVAGTGVREQM